jgi:hypothetical protein
VFLSASFVPRESCGARSLSSFAEGLTSQLSDPELLEPLRFDEAYRLALPRILSDVRRVILEAGFDCDAGLPETLLVQAATDIQGRRRGLLQGQSFVSFLEETIGDMGDAPGANLSAWQEVVGVMRRHLSLCLRQDPKWRRSADEMWHHARGAISHLAERSQARKWLAEAELSRSLREAGMQLLNSTSLEQMGQGLAVHLARLRIPSCFVATAGADGSFEGALSISGECSRAGVPGPFSRTRLLPDELRHRDRRATWLVEPLTLKGRSLGYAVFEMGPSQGRIYSALRDYLAASLPGVSLTAASPGAVS